MGEFILVTSISDTCGLPDSMKRIETMGGLSESTLWSEVEEKEPIWELFSDVTSEEVCCSSN